MLNEIITNSRHAYQAGWLIDIIAQPGVPFRTLGDLVRLINSSRVQHGMQPLPRTTREDGAELVPVELLYILPDIMYSRSVQPANLRGLINAYASKPHSIPPVLVRPTFRGEDLRLAVVDGCHRYVAMMIARSSGADINVIPVLSVYDMLLPP